LELIFILFLFAPLPAWVALNRLARYSLRIFPLACSQSKTV